ncbi:MAG: response regulator transcription factor [Eggerthellaceae bacterium]|jgi:DNA-binding NarL/FixJ family response regulator
MRIVVIEDQTMLRDSLAHAINDEHDMDVVAKASDAAEALDLVEAHDADLVLMDVCTDNGSSGIVAAKHIKDVYPDIRVVIMTGMPEITFVEQAQQAGVDSFVYKNIGTDELVNVLRSTMDGYCTFPHKRALSETIPLNKEEIEILRLVCETRSRKEIAAKLYVSEGTVKRRISEILAKTGYDSILKLAVHAVSSGYIVPGLNENSKDIEPKENAEQ